MEQLLLNRDESDARIAKLHVTAQACKTDLPVGLDKAISRYIHARGKDLGDPIRYERHEFFDNPLSAGLMMTVGCRVIQGVLTRLNNK